MFPHLLLNKGVASSSSFNVSSGIVFIVYTLLSTFGNTNINPFAWQMEFNSRLLKLNDDADIMEELKGFTPEQLKALIAMVKNV